MPEEPRRTEVKPTKAEVRRRIDITESLLIDCASVTEIRRYFAEKEALHLGRRTVERYVEIAEHRIVKAAEPIRSAEIRKAKRRLERCYARAMMGSKKNVFAAIAAQKAINSLVGLNAPKDPDEHMNYERLAQMIVVQRKEMERQKSDSIGIYYEIMDLCDRYKALGEDTSALVQDLAKRFQPPNEQSNTTVSS
jgi:hypothetical protein